MVPTARLPSAFGCVRVIRSAGRHLLMRINNALGLSWTDIGKPPIGAIDWARSFKAMTDRDDSGKGAGHCSAAAVPGSTDMLLRLLADSYSGKFLRCPARSPCRKTRSMLR